MWIKYTHNFQFKCTLIFVQYLLKIDSVSVNLSSKTQPIILIWPNITWLIIWSPLTTHSNLCFAIYFWLDPLCKHGIARFSLCWHLTYGVSHKREVITFHQLRSAILSYYLWPSDRRQTCCSFCQDDRLTVLKGITLRLRVLFTPPLPDSSQERPYTINVPWHNVICVRRNCICGIVLKSESILISF